MVGTLLYLQMYERMYAYDRSPLDANIESEERELTLLAQAPHYLQSRICQRVRYPPISSCPKTFRRPTRPSSRMQEATSTSPRCCETRFGSYRPTDRNALNQRLRLRSDSFQLTSLSRQ